MIPRFAKEIPPKSFKGRTNDNELYQPFIQFHFREIAFEGQGAGACDKLVQRLIPALAILHKAKPVYPEIHMDMQLSLEEFP